MATTIHASTQPTNLTGLMGLSERQPETETEAKALALVRSAALLSFLNVIGETVAALVLIAGGAIATGLATLL